MLSLIKLMKTTISFLIKGWQVCTYFKYCYKKKYLDPILLFVSDHGEYKSWKETTLVAFFLSSKSVENNAHKPRIQECTILSVHDLVNKSSFSPSNCVHSIMYYILVLSACEH